MSNLRTERAGRSAARSGRVAVVCFLLLGVVPAARPVAAGGAPLNWKTGLALQRALQQRLGVAWNWVPLRDHLQQLAEKQGVAVWLDRRIDPSQRIDFQTRDVPFGELLRQLARQVGAEAVLLESVVYIGPPADAARLSVVVARRRAEVAQLPPARSRLLLQRQAWHWDELAVPTQLLAELAEQGGVVVDGLEQIPFDLWPAGDWPPLPWIDRLGLLLIGFERTVAFVGGGRRLELVPLPDEVAGPPDGTAGLMGAPDSPGPKGPGRPGRSRYSLKVDQQPIQRLLEALGKQAQLSFTVDPLARGRLEQRIQLDVQNVTLDQLLEKILSPAGLAFRRRDTDVQIYAP